MRSLLRLVLIGLAWTVASAAVADAPSKHRSVGDVWWRHAVVYEIYVRSFQDSDGDGIGDLNGITQRLDYLRDLGVDAIWISPMFPSPQVDFGYDISDYRDIDPQYGTLADFDRLVVEANKRRIHVLIDMVMNHTSDRHSWFSDAASSRSDPKHDWYVWNDGIVGADGRAQPPNNWVSLFGGSAWEWVPAVKQFYYHKFYKQQPDLNWRNPAVEAAMFSAIRFWLDRGVSGFRLDAVPTLFEDPALRDEPVLGGRNAQGDPNLDHIYTDNLPEVHGTIRRLRALIDSYPGHRLLIGETYLPKTASLDAWYGGAKHNELQLPMDMLIGFGPTLDASTLRRLLTEVYSQIHGSQPLLVFDNHDNIRSWDRFGDGKHNDEIAKIVAALLLTSKSTALLYQGEELGQRTATPSRVEDVRDPIGITGWPMEKGRDGERTPMQWDTSNAQAGFSSNPKTWLPVTPSYTEINVASESARADSLLNWHKRLIELRRQTEALRDGTVKMLNRTDASVLSFARISRHGKAVLVFLNLSGTQRTVPFDLHSAGVSGTDVTTLLASAATLDRNAYGQRAALGPFGALIVGVE